MLQARPGRSVNNSSNKVHQTLDRFLAEPCTYSSSPWAQSAGTKLRNGSLAENFGTSLARNLSRDVCKCLERIMVCVCSLRYRHGNRRYLQSWVSRHCTHFKELNERNMGMVLFFLYPSWFALWHFSNGVEMNSVWWQWDAQIFNRVWLNGGG